MADTLQAEADTPTATRTERRRAARAVLARRALTTAAALSLGATALAFVALSSPAKSPRKAPIALPAPRAAAAAFARGLAAGQARSATPSTSTATQVAIKNYAFAPAALTVTAGTKVTWTNDDVAPHTVTVSSGPVKFSSPTLQKGDSFTYTFTTAGTYAYYCAVHPDMTAKVVVTGSPTPTPTPTPTPSPTTSTPTPSPTSSMPMPPPSGDSGCAVSFALQTFLTHVNSAHLDESPQQQIADILNIDSYIGNHLALVQRMFSPLTNGGLTGATSTALQAFFAHVNAGHLGESPQQQIADILNVNQYIATHLALVQKMASGYEALAC
jgi:plastocyanin